MSPVYFLREKTMRAAQERAMAEAQGLPPERRPIQRVGLANSPSRGTRVQRRAPRRSLFGLFRGK